MMNETVGEIQYDARINTSQLKGDGKKADAIVQDTGDDIEQTGKRSFSAFGTWAKVGLAAAGVATAALAGQVIKTGIEYNTLQQTSRAALTTILGGAQAANAQMDKLDEFARKSPFAKDIFLRAQQQLLGFGVEASKVIPALDAVQDAVAAVGGSGEQITGIVDVLSDIQSTGRVTGQEFQRLGFFGIDAARIIGEQMGLTSEEIKEMASKPGGIPAAKVWDPLTQGLEKEFGGAADNVKNTFAGTTDRISAAFRDIGSAIAAPFVDPRGGGLAIEWGNKFADSLRTIEKGVAPVVANIKNFIGEIIIALKPVTDFIANNRQAWEFLRMALVAIAAIVGALIVSIGVGLVLAFAAVQLIINFIIGLVEQLITWFMQFIDTVNMVIAIIGVFGDQIAKVFSQAWETIRSTFSNVGKWIADRFIEGINIIKAVFGTLGSFFRGVWNSIVNIFSTVGTVVGNAIGNSFKAVINGIINGAASIINGFIDAINGAVDVINNIPGVDIGKIGRLPVPQLATGGIVTSPTLAMIGEGRESEAVIPLSKLDSMIDSTPNKGSNVTIELNMSGVMTRSRSDMRIIAQDMIESVNEQLRARRLPEIGDGNLRKGAA